MQRRQFRIEALLQPRATTRAEELAALVQDKERRKLARGAAELAAAMEAMENACGLVLGTAERVDENARILASGAQGEDTRALAHDIREQMARIFELCNFQDMAGQRIAKVIGLLTGLDERLSGLVPGRDIAGPSAGLLNGPRLDGASGHVSQEEIDSIFALAFD